MGRSEPRPGGQDSCPPPLLTPYPRRELNPLGTGVLKPDAASQPKHVDGNPVSFVPITGRPFPTTAADYNVILAQRQAQLDRWQRNQQEFDAEVERIARQRERDVTQYCQVKDRTSVPESVPGWASNPAAGIVFSRPEPIVTASQHPNAGISSNVGPSSWENRIPPAVLRQPPIVESANKPRHCEPLVRDGNISVPQSNNPPTVPSPAAVGENTPSDTSTIVQLLQQLLARPISPSTGTGGGEPPEAVASAKPIVNTAHKEDKSPEASTKSKRSTLKVGKFDGSACVDTFLLKFDTCAEYNQWCEQDKLAQLMTALEGNASQLLHSCRGQLSYASLREKLCQRYSSQEMRDRYQHELRARKQKGSEFLQTLATEIERLSALGYPDTPPESRDSLFNLSVFFGGYSGRRTQL